MVNVLCAGDTRFISFHLAFNYTTANLSRNTWLSITLSTANLSREDSACVEIVTVSWTAPGVVVVPRSMQPGLGILAKSLFSAWLSQDLRPSHTIANCTHNANIPTSFWADAVDKMHLSSPVPTTILPLRPKELGEEEAHNPELPFYTSY